MGIFKPAGVLSSPKKVTPANLEVFNDLGFSLNDYTLEVDTPINGTSTKVLTVSFLTPTAADLFNGFEVVTSCEALSFTVVSTATEATLTLTHNPITLDEESGNVYILINHRRLTSIKVPLRITSYGFGTLQSDEVVNFELTEVGDTLSKNILLVNASLTCSIEITSCQLISDYGLDFRIPAEYFPIQLEPEESFYLPVYFTPTHNSTRVASLKFLYNDTAIPNIELGLVGEGVSLGVTNPSPTVTFTNAEIPQAGLPLVTGNGNVYKLFRNTSSRAFIVREYTFTSTVFSITYPDFIAGTVISPNEVISIPIAYTNATQADIPDLTLQGYYV